MSVLNDYKCPVHGFFESHDPTCPAGCKDVNLVFLKPVSVKSEGTKHNDRTLNQLALDFKMGDIKSAKEGEAQPPRYTQPNSPFAPRWEVLPNWAITTCVPWQMSQFLASKPLKVQAHHCLDPRLALTLLTMRT
jgi:hypothetical protein